MQPVSYRTILRYYWMQMRKHRGYFYLIFFAYGIGVSFGGIIGPFLYHRVIDVVASAKTTQAAWPLLINLLILIAINSLIFRIGFRIGDVAISRFHSTTMKDLVEFSFSRLTNHSYKFFTNSFAGSLVTKVKRFVRSFEDGTDQVFIVFWLTLVQIIGVITALFFTVPILALILLIWTFLYIAFAWHITKKKAPLDLKESIADSKITGRLADAMTNILNIKIFGSRKKEIANFSVIAEKEREARYTAWSYGNKINAIQSTMFAILEFGSITLVLYLWRQGIISAGTIVLVQIYLIGMFDRLWNLGRAMGKVTKSLADASELVEIFETPIEITDPTNPEPLRIHDGMIAIRNISFRYGKKANSVFTNFSLEIPSGQRLGLVGHSGAGKSTITKLLLRFADVQEGAITIDGQDIRAITQDDLRSVISYVPQDPILFHRSLRENIAYGNPHASEEEILEASKKAHAHEFIEKLPQGYETLVGERGVKLSGGERQRVAIARAMLKNAPILILDEATSSLDSVSEKYIQEALRELMKNRTTIVIAHRLSTVQNLDRIVVIKNGAIAEDGMHADLLAKSGVYANFWQHQTSGFIQ